MLNEYIFAPMLIDDTANPCVCTDDNARELKFPLPRLQRHLTTDAAEIHARQAVIRDLMQCPDVTAILAEGLDALTTMHEIATKNGNIAQKDNESALYSLLELQAFTETVIQFQRVCTEELLSKLQSDRLRAFFTTIGQIADDPQFQSLKTWIGGLQGKLRHIRSATVGVNFDAQLNIREIGLVSINEQPFMSESVLDRALRKEKADPDFTCIATIGIRESGSLIERNNIVLNGPFYDAMNGVLKNLLRSMKKYITDELIALIQSMAERQEEIDFYVAAATYVEGLYRAKFPLIFPEVADDTTITSLYNPLFLDNIPVKNIVPSDVRITEQKRIFILTGPNSGGKTVYLTAIGNAQMLFQLGLPVTARNATMRIYNNIVTQFVREIQKSTESRLANEVIRLRENLESVGRETLFLTDEIFSSTSAYDAMILSDALVAHLGDIGCTVFYVTHLHELAVKINENKTTPPYDRIATLSAKVENGRRSYEIIEHFTKELSSSLARDVVIENGLGFLFR